VCVSPSQVNAVTFTVRERLETYLHQVFATNHQAINGAEGLIKPAKAELQAARNAYTQAQSAAQQALGQQTTASQRVEIAQKAATAAQEAKLAADKAFSAADAALNSARTASLAAKGDVDASTAVVNGFLKQKPAMDTEYASSLTALQKVGAWPTTPGAPTQADIQTLKAKDEKFFGDHKAAQTTLTDKQNILSQKVAARKAAHETRNNRDAQSKSATTNLNSATQTLIQAQTALTAAQKAYQAATATVTAAVKTVGERIEGVNKAYQARIDVLTKAVNDATAAQTLATNTVGAKATLVGHAQQHRNIVAAKLRAATDELQKSQTELHTMETQVSAATEGFGKAKQHRKNWADAVDQAQKSVTTFVQPAV